MPPRPTPPGSSKPRRGPGPVMPGGWIWLVIGLMMLGVFIVSNFPTSYVEMGDLIRLLKDPDQVNNIKKVTWEGSERVTCEVIDREKLPEEIKKHVSTLSNGGGRFTTKLPPGGENSDFISLLN